MLINIFRSLAHFREKIKNYFTSKLYAVQHIRHRRLMRREVDFLILVNLTDIDVKFCRLIETDISTWNQFQCYPKLSEKSLKLINFFLPILDMRKVAPKCSCDFQVVPMLSWEVLFLFADIFSWIKLARIKISASHHIKINLKIIFSIHPYKIYTQKSRWALWVVRRQNEMLVKVFYVKIENSAGYVFMVFVADSSFNEAAHLITIINLIAHWSHNKMKKKILLLTKNIFSILTTLVVVAALRLVWKYLFCFLWKKSTFCW